MYQVALSNTNPLWWDIQCRIAFSLRRTLNAENVRLLSAEVIRIFRQEVEDELAHFNSVSVEEREEYDYFEEDGVELARLLSVLSSAPDDIRNDRSPTQQ